MNKTIAALLAVATIASSLVVAAPARAGLLPAWQPA